jgi:hypothetical protein
VTKPAVTDATNGLGQLSAGNKAAAIADLRSAGMAIGGTTKLDAATAAVKTFNDGQGS